VLDFSEFTAEDNEAIDIKFAQPDQEVACPRCGKQLQFFKKTSAEIVLCETENCLHASIRGI
jgi:hypothetical protein